MITYFKNRRKSLPYRVLSAFIAFTFSFSYIVPPSSLYAQGLPATVMNLPVPGTPVPLTPGFTPARIIGMTIHADNPLMFDFMVDPGDMNLNDRKMQDESLKLVKYFLASLTVPAEKLWVNLSPYEKDKIVPEEFGQTEMGTELLAQDYMLKQLTASLMNPEDELGRKFWDRVYEKAQKLFGTTEIPLNTFNKVWIVPEKAVVYNNGLNVFILESHLKVMMEEDYLSLQHHSAESPDAKSDVISGVSSSVIKEVLLPEIEKEVNEGKTFANLRQIHNSLILAAWYKQNLTESLLGQIYADKSATGGLTVQDTETSQKIYEQYVAAFQKGVYNFIKEDYDPATKQIIPRKYFSGGVTEAKLEIDDKTLPDPKILKTFAAKAADASVITAGLEGPGEEISFNMPFRKTTPPASSPLTFEDAILVSRKPVVGYNMKGELLTRDVDAFLEGIAADFKANPVDPNLIDVVAFFAEGDLKQARVKIDQLVKDNIIPEGFIKLGAQNMRVQDIGAYTAHAPSLKQLKDWGVETVLLGHSEIATTDRGEPSYVEPDDLIARKAETAVNAGLRVFLAYGETKSENDAGRTEEVLTRQLTSRLSRVTGEQMLQNQMVLAYEPVWAIGEGAKPASTEVAEQYSKLSRKILFDIKGPDMAAGTAIQYGGSMSAKNVGELSKQSNIDGGLIGGASKKWETAVPIYRTFAQKQSASSPIAVFDGKTITVRDREAYEKMVNSLGKYFKILLDFNQAGVGDGREWKWTEDPITSAREELNGLKPEGEAKDSPESFVTLVEELNGWLSRIEVAADAKRPTIGQLFTAAIKDSTAVPHPQTALRLLEVIINSQREDTGLEKVEINAGTLFQDVVVNPRMKEEVVKEFAGVFGIDLSKNQDPFKKITTVGDAVALASSPVGRDVSKAGVKKPTILVVDQVGSLWREINDELGNQYEVIGAMGGEKALEILERDRSKKTISLVITENKMPPGMRGIMLAQEIGDKHPEVRVILINNAGASGQPVAMDLQSAQEVSHNIQYLVDDLPLSLISGLSSLVKKMLPVHEERSAASPVGVEGQKTNRQKALKTLEGIINSRRRESTGWGKIRINWGKIKINEETLFREVVVNPLMKEEVLKEFAKVLKIDLLPDISKILTIGDAVDLASSPVKVTKQEVHTWSGFDDLKLNESIQITLENGVRVAEVGYMSNTVFSPSWHRLSQSLTNDIHIVEFESRTGRNNLIFNLGSTSDGQSWISAFRSSDDGNYEFVGEKDEKPHPIDVAEAMKTLTFRVFKGEKRIEIIVSKEWFDFWKDIKKRKLIADTELETLNGYRFEFKLASSPVGETIDERQAAKDLGGIDLNPGNMDFRTNDGGGRIRLPMPDMPLENIKIDGLVPIIIRVAPVANLPLLLGLADQPEPDDAAGFRPQPPPADAPRRFKAREVEEVGLLN